MKPVSFLLHHRKAVAGVLSLGLVVMMLASVSANAKNQPPAPPPMPVTVKTMSEESVLIWSEFSGRLQAVDYAEIRPEVSGRLTEVKIEDGQVVKAGDILFVIDPAPYKAAVDRAEANLASARSNASFAQTEYQRGLDLVKTQAIAKRVFDQRVSDNKVAQASVRSAAADLEQAKINLDHAYVKAPISGRVSRAEITLGNLVQSGSGAPLLTSIVSNNGIYADFEVDEGTYMRNVRNNASASDQEKKIQVELVAQGDKSAAYKGYVYSFDNRINPSSGTIRARAKFDNIDNTLVPGMFVKVRMGSSGEARAVTVTERAIGNDQNKKFVYIVGEGNKVVYREVKLGDQVDGRRVVLSGLAPGDRVIIDNTQKLKPDAIVSPKEEEAPPAPAAAPAPTGAPVTSSDVPAAALSDTPAAPAPEKPADTTAKPQ